MTVHTNSGTASSSSGSLHLLHFFAFADSSTYYIGTNIARESFGAVNGEFVVNGGWCKNLSFRHGAKQLRFNGAMADGHVENSRFSEVKHSQWDLTGKWDGSFQ